MCVGGGGDGWGAGVQRRESFGRATIFKTSRILSMAKQAEHKHLYARRWIKVMSQGVVHATFL